jgi:hypothetical protein
MNLTGLTREAAEGYPGLWAIAEARVRPLRQGSTAKSSSGRVAERWWEFGHSAIDLYAAAAGLRYVLAIPRVSQNFIVARLPTGMVYSEQLVIVTTERFSVFSVLQCRLHETWSRLFGSSLERDPRYTSSTCFETFPSPTRWKASEALEGAGRAYYEHRASVMVRNGEGLTKTYNRFHDPDERNPGILTLRELHSELDRAVLDAYGWRDVQAKCEFVLDYEIDDETSGDKKKPWRYRWPDETRDDVLARLVELNGERAEEEARLGMAMAAARTPTSRSKRATESPEMEGFFS